jgi:hypothetical protein
MDTAKIDTNSLLNVGVDTNLHPLLASTSILPGILTTTQNQLIAPVDPLLVGYNYVTPIATTTSSLLTSNPLIPTSSSPNSLTAQIATALSTPATVDPLLAPVQTVNTTQPVAKNITTDS